MNRDLIALVVWLTSAPIALLLIYFKQKRYFGWGQPAAIVMMGPMALILAIFCPADWFTSRDKAEGR